MGVTSRHLFSVTTLETGSILLTEVVIFAVELKSIILEVVIEACSLDSSREGAEERLVGNVLGNILNLFVAISCLGTCNGLMLGSCRCMYALSVRGQGPAPKIFSQVDPETDMPTNSSVFTLMVTAVWFVYFYSCNLAGMWEGPFVFDATELPIITIYMMYLPIFIQWMRKEKDQSVMKRFVLPILAFCGSCFMILACVVSHGIACVWYFIVFAIVMVIGYFFEKTRARKLG